MAGKNIAVKKYVVRLSADEREQLEALIRNHPKDATIASSATVPITPKAVKIAMQQYI